MNLLHRLPKIFVLSCCLVTSMGGLATAQVGTVKSHQKISATEGNFTGLLDAGDWFGFDATSIADLDGDGIDEIVVGAPLDDDGGENRGAVWVLLLNTDGTVKSHQKISSTEGGFTGILEAWDLFGVSVTSPGDWDGDGGKRASLQRMCRSRSRCIPMCRIRSIRRR